MNKKLLFIALGAAIGAAVAPGSAQALTVDKGLPGNDCPPGGFENCEINGSPTIIKFGADLSSIDDQNGFFSTITGAEWSFSNILTKVGEPSEIIGATWTYTPGAGDPGITAFTVKYGRFFDRYIFEPGDVTTTGTFLLDADGPALSHITFFDTDATTPIPTPALLPGLVGMGIAAIRKRRAEVDASTEA